MTLAALARACFEQALAALDPRAMLRRRLDGAVEGEQVARHFLLGSLPLVARSAGFDSRQGPPAGAQGSSKLPPVVVVAAGKAAVPMLAGWLEATASVPTAIYLVRPGGGAELPPELRERYGDVLHSFTAGHPEPDAVSLQAGGAILRAVEGIGDGSLVALISGGGSALLEVPRTGGLEQLREINRRLVASGAGIGDINCIRKHRSAIKGGWLAAAASGARQESWILSDVPPGRWTDVASGPTCPDATTQADFEAVWRRWLPGEPEPHPETPKPGDRAFARASWHCLADNHDACAALAAVVRDAGREPVVVDHAADEWDEERAAEYLMAQWRALRAEHPRGCLIAGGEVRVRLREGHGRGGRNQALALRIAPALEGREECFLSAGTDGVDGSSDAAGACVDGGTVGRIRAAGLDPGEHVRRQDAHAALEAAGALIRTGPTGNNLRDLRLFL